MDLVLTALRVNTRVLEVLLVQIVQRDRILLVRAHRVILAQLVHFLELAVIHVHLVQLVLMHHLVVLLVLNVQLVCLLQQVVHHVLRVQVEPSHQLVAGPVQIV